ncbi:MAG: RMD1 family protein [Crocinitomicaceae bacterium]
MINAIAFHVGNRINLREIRKRKGENLLRKGTTFLLYGDNDRFFYFKDFGGLVCFNMTENEAKQELLKYLQEDVDRSFREKFEIEINPNNEIEVDFTTIYLPEPSLDFIQIIGLNLAQSVALDHYQKLCDSLLEDTNRLSNHLEQTGKINLSRKELAKHIGKTLNLKNRIAENLYIFEAPPLAWKDVKLSEVDAKLNAELDFKNRFASIQHSLDIVKENLELFKDILQHKHSSLLEWIIIILILFEVIHVLL